MSDEKRPRLSPWLCPIPRALSSCPPKALEANPTLATEDHSWSEPWVKHLCPEVSHRGSSETLWGWVPWLPYVFPPPQPIFDSWLPCVRSGSDTPWEPLSPCGLQVLQQAVQFPVLLTGRWFSLVQSSCTRETKTLLSGPSFEEPPTKAWFKA